MTSTVLSALMAAALGAACGGTSLTEVGGPGGVRCQTSLGGSLPAVGASGGQFTVPVVAARDCLWTTTSEAAWLQVSPRSGQGETDLVVTVAENQQAQSRTAGFLLNDSRFTVTQDAPLLQPPAPRPFPQPPPASPSTCTYALEPPAASFGRTGGEGQIRIVTAPACAWVAASTAGWITLLSDAAGTGTTDLRYRVSPFGGRERTAAIVVSGRTHTVTQRRDDD